MSHTHMHINTCTHSPPQTVPRKHTQVTEIRISIAAIIGYLYLKHCIPSTSDMGRGITMLVALAPEYTGRASETVRHLDQD